MRATRFMRGRGFPSLLLGSGRSDRPIGGCGKLPLRAVARPQLNDVAETLSIIRSPMQRPRSAATASRTGGGDRARRRREAARQLKIDIAESHPPA